MAEEQKNFWATVPGILTGLAAVLTAVSGLYVAISGRTPSKPPEATRSSGGEVPSGKPAEDPPPVRVAGAPTDVFILRAVIDDPDGYTNVRSLKSASSAIVARVERGEEFTTYVQDGNWWQVRTREGKIGYMHVSRIRILSDR